MTTTFDLTAGPDAGRRMLLSAGRHLLGRARHCSVVVDDPAVEPHHLLLEVSAAGSVELVQLAGRSPVSVDEQPVGAGRVVGSIEVGDSRIDVVAPAETLAALEEGTLVAGKIDITRCDDVSSAIAAASRRGRRLHRASIGGSVVAIGIGEVRVPLDIVDGSGLVIPPGDLPLALQPLVERATRQSGLPILLDVAVPGLVVGIVDTDPRLDRARSVARSIASQLAGGAISEAMPELVIAAPGDPELDASTALLEINARWRGRWTPDATHPERASRLHVAGCRPSV